MIKLPYSNGYLPLLSRHKHSPSGLPKREYPTTMDPLIDDVQACRYNEPAKSALTYVYLCAKMEGRDRIARRSWTAR